MSEHEGRCYELVADCRLRASTDLFAHTWDPVVLAALRGDRNAAARCAPRSAGSAIRC